MEKLGYVRQVVGQWAVGNEYLRRWLRQEWDTLHHVQAPVLDESSFEELLQLGHRQENQAFQSEVRSLENGYAALMDMQHRCGHAADRPEEGVEQELDRLQRYLAAAKRDLHRAEAGARTGDSSGAQPPPFRSHTGRGV
jgi:hypothetical protein